jgi:sterol desaturase/sphingolipid hydroxylase (fatty acid hydroxylase superfamily)
MDRHATELGELDVASGRSQNAVWWTNSVSNLRHLVLIFLVVQSSFVLLDLYELRRACGRPPLRDVVTRHRTAIGFLLLVWVGYFAIQSLLFASLPSLDATLAWAAKLWDIDRSVRGDVSRPRAMSLVALSVATYFVVGFWDYCAHRWILHSRRGWFLHESHHLPTQVHNVMPGISVRPLVAPTTFLTYACSAVTILGALRLSGKEALFVPYLATLPGLVLLFAVIGSASHSCFLRRFTWIHRFFKTLLVTTPQEHLLHHTTTLHGNYGNFMTFWDRLCGTYLDPAAADPGRLRLGLPYDQDFLGAVTGGWCKLPPRLRARCEVGAFCYITDIVAAETSRRAEDSTPHHAV